MKHSLIKALLRLYPRAWRAEYGPELCGVLEARPLTARAAANVLWSGLRQRVRSTEPWVLMGLALMPVSCASIVRTIIAPAPYSPNLEFSPYSLPPVAIPMVLLFEFGLLGGCGCWTVLRHGGTLPRAGLAAIKMQLLNNGPWLLLALLIGVGALDVITLGPGDTPTTFAQHGFTYTFYSAQHKVPAAWMVVIRLAGPFDAWILGALGGLVGRKLARRHSPASSG